MKLLLIQTFFIIFLSFNTPYIHITEQTIESYYWSSLIITTYLASKLNKISPLFNLIPINPLSIKILELSKYWLLQITPMIFSLPIIDVLYNTNLLTIDKIMQFILITFLIIIIKRIGNNRLITIIGLLPIGVIHTKKLLISMITTYFLVLTLLI